GGGRRRGLCGSPPRGGGVDPGAPAVFRWSCGSWRVNAELPGPAGFTGASQFVRPDDIADSVPCGDDIGTFVEAVRPYAVGGFTEIALVQVGGDHQQPFLDWAEKTLLPALRDL
ncbi:LLM class F420-dependent oxidoreductase, partial [Streptomyces sp. NPDC059802]